MPIDASIPLSGQPLRLKSPLESLMQVEQLRLQQENSAGLAEQRRGLEEQRAGLAAERQAKAETAAREAAEEQALRELLAQGPVSPEKLASIVGPERAAKIDEGFAAVKTRRTGAAAQALGAVEVLPLGLRQDTYAFVREELIANGSATAKELPEQYSPDVVAMAIRRAMSPEKQAELNKPIAVSPGASLVTPGGQTLFSAPRAPVSVAPGSTLVDPANPGTPLYTAPKAPEKPASAQEYEYAVSKGYKGTFEQYQTEDANRRRPTVTVNAMTAATDPEAIAAGIMRGELPPNLIDYSRAAQGAIATILAKKGYNLSNAKTDWAATQKHFQTLNGAQQTRIRQAVDTAYHSLDLIDDLSEKWKGGKFPLLNKANLAAAKSGVYGKDAATIATQLDAQINDLTSEMSQVYMGGNSPTDHALKLAASNLSASWSNDVLKDMTQLARKNLQMRQNAIANVGVLGTGAANPYAPQRPEGPPPPPPPGGGISYQDYLNSRKPKGGG